MKFCIHSLGIFLVLCGANVHAATAYWAANVQSVYPQSDGSFVINFASDSSSGCTSTTNPKNFFVTPAQNGVTTDGAKAMLATVLTAFVTGNTISFAFDNSTSFCYINRLAIQ